MFEYKIRSFKLKIRVAPHVFKPCPDTFFFGERMEIRPGEKVLEIGTGTGILGIAAAKIGAGQVVAADISPYAVACARYNAKLNGVAEKFRFYESDLFRSVPWQKFDVIIFNPPFSSSYFLTEAKGTEDHWYLVARDSGRTGNKVLSRFLKSARRYCHKSSRIYIIISDLQDTKGALKLCRKYFRMKLAGVGKQKSHSKFMAPSANINLKKIRKAGISAKIGKDSFVIKMHLVKLTPK